MTSEELRTCYTTYHRRFYLIALAITMDRQAAEDAVHDALERLLRTKRRPEKLLSYVTRAVRNAAIDHARRRRRFDGAQRAQDILEYADEPCGISPAVLVVAFDALHPDEREVIWLHVYADMTFREISDLRRRRLNTVTSWYRRGIKKLQEILEVENEPH